MLELGLHSEIYPEARVTGREAVRVQSIDSWIADNMWDRSQYNYVSLDIQGYELQALQGMELQLRYVDYVYTEVNTKEVYKGNAMLSEIDDLLASADTNESLHRFTSLLDGVMRFMQERE